jgi:Fe-S-cluster-containing hydrogenase component 2
MIEKDGIPTKEQIISVFPSLERINKGPVAVIECYQEIPCNPCATSCRFEAIHIGENINKRPDVTSENCTGCLVCLTKCPGLAISIVDGSKSKDYIHYTIPYEMVPLPEVGEKVAGLDREGAFLARVKVIKVRNPKSYDRTPLITLEVPRDILYDFKCIRRSQDVKR